MKYLLDTNIFLEILMKQTKSDECKKFIENNDGNICISDFALHSIGVILFRNKLFESFNLFVEKFISQIYMLTIDKNSYTLISNLAKSYKLDFDDCYQITVAKEFNLTLITLDSDFNNLIKKEFKILNL